jgi:hypothetical protein
MYVMFFRNAIGGRTPPIAVFRPAFDTSPSSSCVAAPKDKHILMQKTLVRYWELQFIPPA